MRLIAAGSACSASLAQQRRYHCDERENKIKSKKMEKVGIKGTREIQRMQLNNQINACPRSCPVYAS